MYTCPSDDLHILYADGEMPEKYVKDYEAHIKSCQKCSAKLKRIEDLNRMLREDTVALNNSIHFTQEDLDSSFERLRLKLSFKSVTEDDKGRQGSVFNFKGGIVSFAAGIAAALAVVLVVPGGKTESSQGGSFTPVARTEIMSTANQVKLDGALDARAVNAMLAPDAAENGEHTVTAATHGSSGASVFTAGLQSNSAAANLRGALISYDVFAMPNESSLRQAPDAGFTFQITFHANHVLPVGDARESAPTDVEGGIIQVGNQPDAHDAP